jgi:hypothetical protein
VAGVGVFDRGGGEAAGEDIGAEGDVESCPEVVKAVKSRSSGNITRQVFLMPEVP